MTRIEKLDKILLFLVVIDVKELKNEPINKKITIEFINSSLPELDLVEWEMKSLKDELLNLEFIKEVNDELRITEKGKTFITREKGFKYLNKIETENNIIREQTIRKFKYDIASFWFSIFAIVIALISLILTILKPK